MKNRLWGKLWLVSVALVVVLSASTAAASKVCKRYSDGCTICDFYGPNGEYQGYIEWCS
jgi:hypothetical protein